MCDCGLHWDKGLVNSEHKVNLLREWASQVRIYSATKTRPKPLKIDTFIPISQHYVTRMNIMLTEMYCMATSVAWLHGKANPMIRVYFKRHHYSCPLQKNHDISKDEVS